MWPGPSMTLGRAAVVLEVSASAVVARALLRCRWPRLLQSRGYSPSGRLEWRNFGQNLLSAMMFSGRTLAEVADPRRNLAMRGEIHCSPVAIECRRQHTRTIRPLQPVTQPPVGVPLFGIGPSHRDNRTQGENHVVSTHRHRYRHGAVRRLCRSSSVPHLAGNHPPRRVPRPVAHRTITTVVD